MDGWSEFYSPGGNLEAAALIALLDERGIAHREERTSQGGNAVGLPELDSWGTLLVPTENIEAAQKLLEVFLRESEETEQDPARHRTPSALAGWVKVAFILSLAANLWLGIEVHASRRAFWNNALRDREGNKIAEWSYHPGNEFAYRSLVYGKNGQVVTRMLDEDSNGWIEEIHELYGGRVVAKWLDEDEDGVNDRAIVFDASGQETATLEDADNDTFAETIRCRDVHGDKRIWNIMSCGAVEADIP